MHAASFRLIAGVSVALGAAGLLLPWLFPGQVPQGVAVVLVATALLLLLLALARRGAPPACDSANPALRRRYTRELMLAMGLYVLVLCASVWLLKHVDAIWLRAMIALLPVPPIGLALRAMVRYVRDTDELQRRIELEAISIAAVGVPLLYLTGGFLQSAAVVDIPADVAMIWVFPLTCFGYGLAKAFVSRRYG